MRRFLLIVGVLVTFSFIANAQKKGAFNDENIRCSVSYIIMMYGDRYDETFYNSFSAIQPPSKFDYNNIHTKFLRYSDNRARSSESTGASSSTGLFKKTQDTSYLNILEEINKANIGKELLNNWFLISENGVFSDKLLMERSSYNKTDQNVLDDQASQVQSSDQNGHKLIAGTYVIVYDIKSPRSTQGSNGKPLYSASVNTHVFKIDFNEDSWNNISANMWIRGDEPAEIISQKKQLYADYDVKMKYVASSSSSMTSEVSYADAANKFFSPDKMSSELSPLENKIPEWQTVAHLYQVKPLTAKIGTKEGLKNGQRFKVYKPFVDKKNGIQVVDSNGVVVWKKVGMMRVTTAAKNESIADGHSPTSDFYQISGAKFTENKTGGATIKQSNDIRTGLSLDYNLGQHFISDRFTMADATIDYMAYIIKPLGIMIYPMITVGFDMKTNKQLINGMYDYCYEVYGETFTKDDATSIIETAFGKTGANYLNASLGVGVGIHPIHFIEIQPFVMFGMDNILPSKDMRTFYGIPEKKAETSAFFLDPGLKLGYNVSYPFQVFVQCDYAVLLGFKMGKDYKKVNDDLNTFGLGHENCLKLKVGVKWTF